METTTYIIPSLIFYRGSLAGLEEALYVSLRHLFLVPLSLLWK
jgi:hypothetical protein